jgi:hypothetical protein
MENFIDKQIKNSDSYKANVIRERMRTKLVKRQIEKDEATLKEMMSATHEASK